MTPPPIRTPILQTKRLVRAPRERVFKAWVDPNDIQSWFGRPEGAEISKVEVDLRVGGHYLIVIRGGDEEFPVVGTYLEIDEPARLVYTFRWERELPFEGGPFTGPTRVTVEFKDVGGDTEVVLTHEGFPNDMARDFHTMGWEWSFDRLADLLDEGPTFPR